MSITASVSGNPITASVTEDGASVAVSPVAISATVIAGIGPQGAALPGRLQPRDAEHRRVVAEIAVHDGAADRPHRQ